MATDEVFQLAKRFVREGTPSRNRALGRYRARTYQAAARLALHARELVRTLEEGEPQEVSLEDGQLRFRFAIEGGSRLMFVDAIVWALVREESALQPWRALGEELRAAA